MVLLLEPASGATESAAWLHAAGASAGKEGITPFLNTKLSRNLFRETSGGFLTPTLEQFGQKTNEWVYGIITENVRPLKLELVVSLP